MLALCLMLLGTYYAQNYAGIIGRSLHVMVLWKDKNILTKEHFLMIQERIENISVPMDIGRIPYKIESAMAGLTADQWNN